jgi:hypothetical protein
MAMMFLQDHCTVNLADLVTAAYLAMICTAVLNLTTLVLTVAVAVVAPAGPVTLAGTVAAPVLELDNAITTPGAAAGPLNVTVAVELAPPATMLGLTATDSRAAARTWSVAALVTVPYLTVMVIEVFALTG